MLVRGSRLWKRLSNCASVSASRCSSMSRATPRRQVELKRWNKLYFQVESDVFSGCQYLRTFVLIVLDWLTDCKRDPWALWEVSRAVQHGRCVFLLSSHSVLSKSFSYICSSSFYAPRLKCRNGCAALDICHFWERGKLEVSGCTCAVATVLASHVYWSLSTESVVLSPSVDVSFVRGKKLFACCASENLRVTLAE